MAETGDMGVHSSITSMLTFLCFFGVISCDIIKIKIVHFGTKTNVNCHLCQWLIKRKQNKFETNYSKSKK